MEASLQTRFIRMLRAFPLRTALFTLGPPLVALALLANAVVHGAHLAYPLVFVVLAVAFAVLMTRYHLVAFRVTRLSEQVEAGE